MAIDSYNSLVSTVRVVLEADDDDEFNEYLPSAISLASQRLGQEIDHSVLLSLTAANSITSATATLTKPSNFRIIRSVQVSTSAGLTNLLNVNYDYLREYWPNPSATGTPKYYADKDVDEWSIAPTAKETFNVQIHYRGIPTEISSGSQTNEFTNDKLSNALYYATVVEMCDWQKNPQWAQHWESKYQRTLGSINNEGRMERRDDGAPPNNPELARNTTTREN